jgi:hypothetical protein
MCIFRTKSKSDEIKELESTIKIKDELIEKLNKENETLNIQLKASRGLSNSLSQQLKNILFNEKKNEDKGHSVTMVDEFLTDEDKEFLDTEDTDQINYCKAIQDEADMLAKELLYLWENREYSINSPFSGIEWGGVSSRIVDGLKAYTKEGHITEQDEQDIKWMFDMFEEFDCRL